MLGHGWVLHLTINQTCVRMDGNIFSRQIRKENFNVAGCKILSLEKIWKKYTKNYKKSRRNVQINTTLVFIQSNYSGKHLIHVDVDFQMAYIASLREKQFYFLFNKQNELPGFNWLLDTQHTHQKILSSIAIHLYSVRK